MTRLITIEDFTDVYVKLRQRGARFLLSKLSLDRKRRSVSAFDASLEHTSNWWEIPLVKERWNRMITGDAHVTFEEYTIDTSHRWRRRYGCSRPGRGIANMSWLWLTIPSLGRSFASTSIRAT